MAHAGGRPTKYRKEFIQIANDYFHTEAVSGEYPTIVGLSNILHVHKDQLTNWEKIYPEFHVSLERGRALGHEILVKRALKDEFNPGFTKFLLINNYGYTSEKTEAKVDANVAISGININFISPKEGDSNGQ